MDGERVIVEWEDAHFDFAVPDVGELRDEYLVRTIGFIIRDTDKWLTIAAEMLPDGGGWRGATSILQQDVRERIRLVEEPL